MGGGEGGKFSLGNALDSFYCEMSDSTADPCRRNGWG